jgi:hypothetical protein
VIGAPLGPRPESGVTGRSPFLVARQLIRIRAAAVCATCCAQQDPALLAATGQDAPSLGSKADLRQQTQRYDRAVQGDNVLLRTIVAGSDGKYSVDDPEERKFQ